jgi:hypothetical protein
MMMKVNMIMILEMTQNKRMISARMDLAIEFILGDRFPSVKEYHEWLQQDENK